MTVELTTQTEAEMMGQSIRDLSAECFAMLNERREKAYAAECASLDEQLAALAGESAEIEGESQGVTERLESATRVIRFEADQLIARGENAQTKLAELEKFKAAVANIEARRREIAERCAQLEEEKRTSLRRAAEEFRESSIALIRGCEAALAGALDETRNILNTLERQVGTELYKVDNLTADERSEQWRTLHRLYFGAVR